MHAACRRIADDWRVAYLYRGAVVNELRTGLVAGATGFRRNPCSAVCAGVSSGKGCLTPQQTRALYNWAMRITRPRRVEVVHLVV